MAATTSSNPISSAPLPSSANPITSVSPITSVAPSAYPPSYTSAAQSHITRLHLDLRGTRFVVDRETLMNLPESVLLCLFPNGLVLTRQGGGYGGPPGNGLGGEEEEEEEVYGVDVSGKARTIAASMTHTLTYLMCARLVRPGMFPLRPGFLVDSAFSVLRPTAPFSFRSLSLLGSTSPPQSGRRFQSRRLSADERRLWWTGCGWTR
jgi:hypothetical protein